MTYGENGVDITGIFMMQLFNYIGLGYNYQNGGKSVDKLTADQLERRVVDKPNYLTYLGYVNFLPACLVGPVYEYADFDNYLNRRADYASIPSTIPAVFKELGVFFFSLVCYFGLAHFNIDRVVQPEFLEYSYGYQLLYMVICITYIELKYVTAWSLGMVSMRASGITYNPRKNTTNKDNSISYDFGRVEVNNMNKFYLDPSLKVKTDHWNISIQLALRRYIYENLYNPADFTDDKKKRSRQFKAQLGTVLVSALWHGLYPGYYISFVHWILYMQIAQEVFRMRKVTGSTIAQLYEKHETLMNIVDNLLSSFVLTYFGMAFHLMTWDRVWTYLQISYFLPYILLYVAFYLICIQKVFSRKGKKAKEEK
jgi:lysophospholipid acyltransferase